MKKKGSLLLSMLRESAACKRLCSLSSAGQTAVGWTATMQKCQGPDLQGERRRRNFTPHEEVPASLVHLPDDGPRAQELHSVQWQVFKLGGWF